MNNYSKLLAFALVASLAAAVIPTVSAQGALPGAGTFVGPTDPDTTYALAAPAPAFADIGFVDTNSDGSIQNGEPVYLTRDAAAPFKVAVGDVRLTSAFGKAAGTITSGGDDDFDRTLDITPLAAAGDFCFYFFDADTNTAYNLGDLVVVHVNAAACATGVGATAAQTIGINDIALHGATAFTQTVVSTSGYNSPLTVGTAAMVFAQIGFFNGDGDAGYSTADTVYFNLAGVVLPGVVNIADVRLTKLVSNAAGVQITATDIETTYALVSDAGLTNTFGAAPTCFVDVDGNGVYNAGEPAYLQAAAACGVDSVAAGDYRLIGAQGFMGGTLVKGSDDDFARDTIALVTPVALFCFFDADGTGAYSAGDVLYLETGAAGGTVTVNDIALSGANAFTTVTAATTGLNNACIVAVGAGGFPAGFDNTVAFADIGVFDADGIGAALRTTGDFLYLDFDSSATPSINDLRMTKVGSLAAGTLVKVGDIDTQYTLTVIAAPYTVLCYVDLDGDAAQDINEPAYLTLGCAGGVVANSVRLVANAPYMGGTLVKGSDDDFSRALTAGAAVIFCYYDANGNAVYDYQENLYIDVTAACTPVSANDIQLTGANAGQRVTGSTPGLNNPLTAAAAFGFTLAALTVYNGDGIGAAAAVTTGDVLYFDLAAASANPTVGDVRLTGLGNNAGQIGGGVGGSVGGTTAAPTSAAPTSGAGTSAAGPSAAGTSAAGTSAAGTSAGTTTGPQTPGFELVALVAALGAALVLVRRKL